MLGPATLTMATSMEVMNVPTNSTSKVSAGCAGTVGGDGLIASAFEAKSAGAVPSREQAWRRPCALRGRPGGAGLRPPRCAAPGTGLATPLCLARPAGASGLRPHRSRHRSSSWTHPPVVTPFASGDGLGWPAWPYLQSRWPGRVGVAVQGSRSAGSELVRCPDKVGVAGGRLAVGQQEGVLEADAGVDATPYGVFDENPGCLAVAVLEAGSHHIRPVQDGVEGGEPRRGVSREH